MAHQLHILGEEGRRGREERKGGEKGVNDHLVTKPWIVRHSSYLGSSL